MINYSNLKGAATMFYAATFAFQVYGQQSLDQLIRHGVVQPGAGQRAAVDPVRSAPAATATPGTPQSNAKFHMTLPTGWQAGLLENGAVIARSGDGAASVLIAPVFRVGNTQPLEWMRQRASAALSQYFNNAAVASIYPSRTPNSALASVEYSGPGGPGVAHVMFFVAGDVGTLFAIAAPRQAMAQAAPTLMRILQSFSFAGEKGADGPASAAGVSVNFTKFSDPREAAFTVDVPAGWKVQGGTIWISTLDFRPFVYAVSADGSTMIRIGDPKFGTFTAPSRLLAMAGMYEGMNYSPGYGNVWPIRRYLPGPAFGQMYAQKLTREVQASGLQFKTVRPLPEFSYSGYGGAVMIMAGEASFACTRNGKEYGGTVYAATQRMGMQGSESAIWWASALADFISPASEASAANQILLHMFKSFQMNPQWVARQSNMAVQTAQIAHEAYEHISKVSNDSYWSKAAIIDKTHQGFDDYIRGVVRLRDRDTGEVIEGRAGKNHYYTIRGDKQHPIGSDREIQNPDVHELEQIR